MAWMAAVFAAGLLAAPLPEDVEVAFEFMPWARERGWRAAQISDRSYLALDPRFVAPSFQAGTPRGESQLRLAVERPAASRDELSLGVALVTSLEAPILLERQPEVAWMDDPFSPDEPQASVLRAGVELRMGKHYERWAWYLSLLGGAERVGQQSGGFAMLGLTLRF